MSQLRTNSIVPVGGIPVGASGGGIIQVVSTNKVDTFSTTSTSFTDVTGLNVSITPRSTNNKILIFVSLSYSLSGDSGFMRVTRNGTAIGGGTAVGNRQSALGDTAGEPNSNWTDTTVASAKYVFDTPSSTSSLTYQVQILTTGNTRKINTNNTDSDSSGRARLSSQIIAMEVSG